MISKITNQRGATTSFTYDSSRRVTEVDQSNTTSGSAGTSTTRFSYPSGTSTLVAGPNTSTGTAVASGDHTTYTLDSNNLVLKTLDPVGRERSTTYTTQGLDTASSTTGAAGGSTSATTTYGHDQAVNGGLSLTSATGQGGNKSTAAYNNTDPNPDPNPAITTHYLPSSTTTDANTASGSNQSSYTYNGAGNQLTATSNTASGSTATGTAVTSTVTRNTDGTVATATAPGNGSNQTVYHYNANHQLDTITPVTGSSLGARAFTYDDFGRLRTQTDGAGNTTTYTYDKDDRTLTTGFSDNTATVTNTYDTAGNLTAQASGGGTITNTFDQLNQLTSTVNTSSGGTISYGYDKTGNQTSITDTRGTTTEAFDASNVLTSTTYPKASGNGQNTTYFKTDSNGRRTDTWLQANATETVWAAHTHQSYDATGRVSEVLAEVGPATSATAQMDTVYCYNSAGSGTSCGTASATDMSKLQWSYNKLISQTTRFTYDGMGRLTRVAETGGSNGNDTYAYSYDARGNRLTANVTGTDTSSQTLTFNAANQITSAGYSYDGAGNLTAAPGATYSYNAAEQMASANVAGVNTTYTYAGASQNAVLTSNTTGKNPYKIAYGKADPQGNPEIAQYTVGTLTAYVEQDPVTGQPTMLHSSSDIAALYIYDGTGSPIGLISDYYSVPFFQKYDPYGLVTVQQNSGGNSYLQNPYAFKGGLQDRATGFVKYGQRWYNPTTGTWTQQDTLDAPLDAANGNRYAYAGDDPINNIDPSGTLTKSQERFLCMYYSNSAIIEGAAGGVAGAVGGASAAASAAIVDAPITLPSAVVSFLVSGAFFTGSGVNAALAAYFC